MWCILYNECVKARSLFFCNMWKRKTKFDFIEQAQKLHGDRYDYSKVEYVNNRERVNIICPIHGEFWQKPYVHNMGSGCPKCGKSQKMSSEEFIAKAREIHKDRFDYSKTVYVNNKTKVCIICKNHGVFWQLPNNHLAGKGCEKCARGEITKESFIKKARKVHNGVYDYSDSVYFNKNRKIAIRCVKHGTFFQTPHNHLKGQGCPMCSESKLEREVANFLESKNIKFEKQKTFPWLGKQRLDFYLPDYNIAIECQGEQHFKPVDFAGKGVEWSERHFKKVRERDEVKKLLCEENNVKVLYFTNLKKYKRFLCETLISDVDGILENINKKC